MFRRAYTSSSELAFSMPRWRGVLTSSSSASLTATSRRCYIEARDERDLDTPNYYNILGLNQAIDGGAVIRQITPQEIRECFLREVRKLRDDESTKLTRFAGFKPDYRAANLPENKAERDKLKAKKLQALVQAYSFLYYGGGRKEKLRGTPDRALPHLLYRDGLDGSPDIAVGRELETGGAFQDFSEAHQQFIFSELNSGATKSFSDFRSVFVKNSVRWEQKVEAERAPKDCQFLLKLTFDEALYGCVKELTYDKYDECTSCGGTGDARLIGTQCPQCNGNGLIELPSSTYVAKVECRYCLGRGSAPPPACKCCRGSGAEKIETSISLVVEPGTDHLQAIRLPGRGNVKSKSGKVGDLVVTFLVQEHRAFKRNGSDLHILTPVPLSVALLGGVVPVRTLQGSKDLRIRPGTETGTIITVPGFGVPRSLDGSRPAGNLRVHVVVGIPHGAGLTGRQIRALLEHFNGTEESMAGSTSNSSSSATPSPLQTPHIQVGSFVDGETENPSTAETGKELRQEEGGTSAASGSGSCSSSSSSHGTLPPDEPFYPTPDGYGVAKKEAADWEGVTEANMNSAAGRLWLSQIKAKYRSWLPVEPRSQFDNDATDEFQGAQEEETYVRSQRSGAADDAADQEMDLRRGRRPMTEEEEEMVHAGRRSEMDADGAGAHSGQGASEEETAGSAVGGGGEERSGSEEDQPYWRRTESDFSGRSSPFASKYSESMKRDQHLNPHRRKDAGGRTSPQAGQPLTSRRKGRASATI
jgi:DnaJ-class molecular chaperone